MIDLKPCPFCGGEVIFNSNVCMEPDGIWCSSCKAVVRFRRIRVESDEKFERTMMAIANAWNRRVTNENIRTEK